MAVKVNCKKFVIVFLLDKRLVDFFGLLMAPRQEIVSVIFIVEIGNCFLSYI